MIHDVEGILLPQIRLSIKNRKKTTKWLDPDSKINSSRFNIDSSWSVQMNSNNTYAKLDEWTVCMLLTENIEFRRTFTIPPIFLILMFGDRSFSIPHFRYRQQRPKPTNGESSNVILSNFFTSLGVDNIAENFAGKFYSKKVFVKAVTLGQVSLSCWSRYVASHAV